MKRQIKVICSLAVAICMSAVGVVSAQAAGPDLDHEMSITVTASKDAADRLASADAESGTICYDLYKIADVTDTNGFAFETVSEYSELDEAIQAAAGSLVTDTDVADTTEQTEETASDTETTASSTAWTAVAQAAASQILGSEGDVVPVLDGEYGSLSLGQSVTVEKGLYLLVARSTVENATVVKNVTQSDASSTGSTTGSGLATYTLIDDYMYTFTPQLVCVPTNDDLTSTSDSWTYAQDIVLKMGMEPATGEIVINKSLTGYYDGAENATFIFRVDTYYPDDATLYASEVYAMTFTADGSQSVTVSGLPIGAKVSVSEVYSGVNYTRSVSTPETIDLTVAEGTTPEASFANEANGNRAGGGGVTNYFSYVKTGETLAWAWEQHSDGNISTTNGLSDKLVQEIMNLSTQTAAAAE